MKTELQKNYVRMSIDAGGISHLFSLTYAEVLNYFDLYIK